MLSLLPYSIGRTVQCGRGLHKAVNPRGWVTGDMLEAADHRKAPGRVLL